MIAARILTAIVVLAPWLAWTPLASTPGANAVWGVVALVAAWHGWGKLIARAAGHTISAALAIWWGVAAVIGLGGVCIALHVYDARLLVIGGITAHSALVTIEWRSTTERAARMLRWGQLRYLAVPAVIVAVLALVHVLGGAGSIGDRAFDDDGNVVAQIKRLCDTGTLADAVGFARLSQLGGFISLDALVTAFGSPETANVIDGGLGFVLVLVLLVARIRPRDATGAIWATLGVTVATAFVVPWHDLAPLWIAAGLVAALHFTIADLPRTTRAMIPVGVVAGALCALRSELVPVALAYVALAARSESRDRRRLATLFAIPVIVIAPYAIVRAVAWSTVGPARPLLETAHGNMVVHVVLFVAITAAALPLLIFVLRGLELEALGIAVAVQVGAVTSQLVGAGGYGLRFLWPVVLAAVVVALVAVAQRRALDVIALVLCVLIAVQLVEARVAAGHSRSWWRRYEDLLYDVEFARHAAPAGHGYDALLARVPNGAAVAIWVTRPQLVDYAAHSIIDLRTPRTAHLREHSWQPRTPTKLERLLAATHVRWLIIEDDDAYMARAEASWLYRLSCPLASHRGEQCRDTLEALADGGTTLATSGNARLVELR